MDERPERSRWTALRRAAKVAAVITTIFGIVTFPLSVWSTAEFASQKNWLWVRLSSGTRDWFITAKNSGFISSPWIPTTLVLLGVFVFSWMVLLDRRDRRSERSSSTPVANGPEVEVGSDGPSRDTLDAIVRYVLTTPEGRVRLREALQQQGVTINIGTINIYSDALRRDDRVEVKGPPDDPEIVPVRLREQGRAADEFVVKKEDVVAPTGSTQPSVVQADNKDEADENEEEEEVEVEVGPWLTTTDKSTVGKAKHRQHGDYIELSVRNLPQRFMLERFACVVEGPDEDITSAIPSVNAAGSARILYPFDNSPDLVDGDYTVRWIGSSFSSALRLPPAATDEFTIKAGRLVR